MLLRAQGADAGLQRGESLQIVIYCDKIETFGETHMYVGNLVLYKLLHTVHITNILYLKVSYKVRSK